MRIVNCELRIWFLSIRNSQFEIKSMAEKTKKPSKSKTIVVTGTSGFKGSRILRALEKDNRYHSIVVIDYKKPSSLSKKTRFYKMDLTETLADVKLSEILKKEKCDTLVHCAFPITPPKDQAFAHELISIGTLYVFNACAEARVRKVVLASTADVYGAFPTNPNFLQEDFHPARGDRQSQFLKDKIDAEKQALKYAKKYPDRVVTILRPCSILGPTIKSYKTDFLRRPFVLTIMGFDPLIQLIHEDDIIRGCMLAIENDYPGIFNLVGDGVLPLSRIIKICNKRAERLREVRLIEA